MGESMVDEILFLERGYRLRDHATCRAICLLLASLRIATNGDDERPDFDNRLLLRISNCPTVLYTACLTIWYPAHMIFRRWRVRCVPPTMALLVSLTTAIDATDCHRVHTNTLRSLQDLGRNQGEDCCTADARRSRHDPSSQRRTAPSSRRGRRRRTTSRGSKRSRGKSPVTRSA